MTLGGNPFAPGGDDPFGPGGAPAQNAVPQYPVAELRPADAETNALATLSVVFAFLFAPAGAVFGHLGLAQVAHTGQRGRDRALVGLTLSYAVITAVVVGLVIWASGVPSGMVTAPSTTTSTVMTTLPGTTTTTPPPPPPPPTVDPVALQSVLLSVQELQTLLNDPGLQQVWSSDTLGLQPQRGGLEDTSCAGAFFKGTPNAYAGHEPIRFTGTDIGNTTSTGQLVGQGAAVYPDATAAHQALAAYLDYLGGCVGKTTKTIPADPSGPGLVLVFGVPAAIGHGMTRVDTAVIGGYDGGLFSHVVAVKENVLVDNIFITADNGEWAQRVTQAMLDRITS